MTDIALSRPRLGVSVAVWRGEEVLLVRRKRPPCAGCWSLPGGLVEYGETLACAAMRELQEETGVTAEIAGFVGHNEVIGGGDSGKGHIVIAVFVARHAGGTPRPGDDAAEAVFMPPAEIAGLAVTARLGEFIAASRRILAGA